MTDDSRDYEWPEAADLKALLNHHAADVLRAFALDIFIGQPSHTLVPLGQVRDAARVRAQRLDGQEATCAPLDFTGLPCANPATPPHQCYSATAYVADAHDKSEGVQG